MPRAQRQPLHIHKLKRHTFRNGEQVYFCTLPHCKYKVVVALALGKEVICNRCGDPFIMNEVSIRLAKPHCDDCTAKRKPDTDTITERVLETITPPVIASVRSTTEHVSDLRSRIRSIGTTIKEVPHVASDDPSLADEDML